MDPELSIWYHEKRDRVRRHSWEQAFFGMIVFTLVLVGMGLIYLGLANPKSRPIVLFFVAFFVMVVIVRFALVAYHERRLKLEFAKRAMTQ